MDKFIDIDKLIAEIEKRQEARQDRRDTASWENEYWPEGDFSTRDDEDDAILSIITSLQQEQPEVDLKKELKNLLKSRDNGCSALDVARHFYKLGLNARKEE